MGLKDIIHKIWKEKKIIEGEETKNKFYSSQNDFPTEEIARKEFERSKAKLFDVNRWSYMPGVTSGFQLYNEQGEKLFEKRPKVGDYLSIDLPGPTPENWVKVIDIQEEEDMAEFTVSPSPNPKDVGEEAREIKHFFIDEATSTFRVEREGKSIFGFEIGKNEGINNQGKEAGDREFINTLIAEGGWAAFQKLQWEKFADYVVHKIEAE